MKTITRIIVAVCQFEGVKSEAFNSLSRKREIVQARQRSMYFAKKYTKLSLAEIGSACGGKDHATVLHANKTVNELYETDRDYRHELDQLDYIIKGIAVIDLSSVIGPSKMQLQVRLNMSQYRNGRYLYTLFGVKRVSRTRTLFIPVTNVMDAIDMIDESEVDSLNIYMDYRRAEASSEKVREVHP